MEIRRIVFKVSPGKKVNKTLFQPISQVWWYTPIVPAS
jgi:hypothetical protein